VSFFTDLIKCSARGSSHGWIDCWVSRRYIYLSIYLSYLICARSDLCESFVLPLLGVNNSATIARTHRRLPSSADLTTATLALPPWK
jgi:hypothetical protein